MKRKMGMILQPFNDGVRSIQYIHKVVESNLLNLKMKGSSLFFAQVIDIQMIIKADKAFDDFAGANSNELLNKKILGIQ